MNDTTPVEPRKGPARRLFALLNHNWSVTVLGGLLLAFLTPIATGFANLTFGLKSWETFGAANDVDAPGSYLSRNSVYRLPLGERFMVDGSMLLAVNWDNYKRPTASLTQPDGRVKRDDISTSSSLSAEGGCRKVAIHLMRQPVAEAPQFYIMYTSERLKTDECQGFWSRLFG